MSMKIDKFKIGLFLMIGIIIGVTLIIWLGATRFFSPHRKIVAYFDESVQGLNRDSPVKFRGVTIGRVSAIQVAPDDTLVEVVMSLPEDFDVTEDLGVKMGLLGITGQMYLEMDRYPPNARRLSPTLGFTAEYPIITAYPSDVKEFGSSLEKILNKVKAVDVSRISTHLVNITAALDRTLNHPKVLELGPQTAEATAELKKASIKLNNQLDQFQKTIENATGFFQAAKQVARSGDKFIQRTDNNLNRLSGKMERVADNLEKFSKKIEDKPSRVLFGK